MLPLDVLSDEAMLLLLCWAYWLLLDCKAGKTEEQLVKNPNLVLGGSKCQQPTKSLWSLWQVCFWNDCHLVMPPHWFRRDNLSYFHISRSRRLWGTLSLVFHSWVWEARTQYQLEKALADKSQGASQIHFTVPYGLHQVVELQFGFSY